MFPFKRFCFCLHCLSPLLMLPLPLPLPLPPVSVQVHVSIWNASVSVSTANVFVRSQVLSKIRGTNDVDEELADITEAARISNLAPHPMRNLFKPQYRPQLTISLLFMMFQQFTGINAIIFYAPVLFNSIGSGHTASLLNTVIIGAGMLPFANALCLHTWHSWWIMCIMLLIQWCSWRWCASALYVASGLTSCLCDIEICCMWQTWLQRE